MKPRIFLTAMCAALVLTGCGQVPKAERDAALDVVRRNVAAMQAKKIDEMMATIHPKSPAFEKTRTAMSDLVRDYDLKCELAALDVVRARPDEIAVRFVQTTEKSNAAGAHEKTRVTGVHVLKKDGGQWKIFGSDVMDAELLDAPAVLDEEESAK